MKELFLTVKMVCLVFVFCSAAAIASPAQFLTTLHSFDGSDGYGPLARLVQAADGNFYGTTELGGSSGACYLGCGTVFKITPNGNLTTLHSFRRADGATPWAGLVQASDGNFYGTTFGGGVDQSFCGSYGCGTVFKITPSGTLTTLYRFCASSAVFNPCADGSNPVAGLIQAADGDFYGTTTGGGGQNCNGGCGTVFKITPDGKLSTLHSFQFTDGAGPEAGVLQASDGNFYGTTYGGGSGCDDIGCGTVFRITPDGTLTPLHRFAGGDGDGPVAGLVQASDGNFYGTTVGGGSGCLYGCGTVFKITPNGTFTLLHIFAGDPTEGSDADGGLIQASDGNFYGTTYVGGVNNAGTIFRIAPNGALTTLHSFSPGGSDGFYPYAGLIQASDGNFYGTTYDGGDNNYYGTVFRLVLPRQCIVCSTVQ